MSLGIFVNMNTVDINLGVANLGVRGMCGGETETKVLNVGGFTRNCRLYIPLKLVSGSCPINNAFNSTGTNSGEFGFWELIITE